METETINPPVGHTFPFSNFIKIADSKFTICSAISSSPSLPSSGISIIGQQEMAEAIMNYVGSDINIAFGWKRPMSAPASLDENMRYILSPVPSLQYLTRGFSTKKWDYIDEANGKKYEPLFWIFFKSLKKLICLDGTGFQSILCSVTNGVAKVEENGGPIYLGNYQSKLAKGILLYNGNGIHDASNFGAISYNLISAPSLIKDAEYKLFYVNFKDSPSSNYTRTLGWLLGDESIKPDFEGGEIPPDNPYEPGGNSGEGGGDGNFEGESDIIPDSTPPTISSSNTGFTRIYNPTLSQVQSLAQYLWTDESVIQTIWNHIKQYFEDPMQAIIGFNLVPCRVPNGGTTTFKLMYIDTGVSMTAAANQFVDVDCGTLVLEKYYGSALDYSPYTKVSCFLPYIGTVQLNTDEVMDTTLHIKYRIDICSGSCVAKILVNENVLYQYSGHCAIPIPFSAADFSSYVSSAISVAKLAVGAAAGGAMGAVASAGTDPSQQTNQVVTTTQVTDTARNPTTGRQITTGTRTITETRQSPADQSSTMASFSGLTPSNIANTVGQIMGSKPHVEHSGSFSGNTGSLGVRRPFLIIERPNMCMPAQYQQFNGFPSMITETLSNLKGFTKVQQVQLTGMTATNPEQSEILEFLKSGVIL